MTDINKQLEDLSVQYQILISELKEIYPAHKSNPTNSEIQIIYENIRSQIQNIFSQMENIKMELTKTNEDDQRDMNKLNTKILDNKIYYDINKPILQEKIDSNKSAVPREEEIEMKLRKKYLEFAYILVLLGITIYSLRKLLY